MDPDVCNCHRLPCSNNGASLHPLALHVRAICFVDLFLDFSCGSFFGFFLKCSSCFDYGALLYSLTLHLCTLPFFSDWYFGWIFGDCTLYSDSGSILSQNQSTKCNHSCERAKIRIQSAITTSLYSLALNIFSIFFRILFLDALCIWIIEPRYIFLFSMVSAGLFFFLKSDLRNPFALNGECWFFLKNPI